MVLRGAQFQRSGPARCKFLTRQALSSYRVTFAQRRSDADCLEQGNQMTRRPLMRFHGNEDRQGSRHGAGESGDMNPERPTISSRTA